MIDATVAASVARNFASAWVSAKAAGEFAIAVKELATNVIVHGGGCGVMDFGVTDEFLEVSCGDRGPANVDPSLIFLDRDERLARGGQPGRGLGTGGAAVRRMMDELSWEAGQFGGLTVRARKRRCGGAR